MAQLSLAPISAVLGTTAATIYTVPGGSEQTLSIALTSFSVVDVSVTLWIVEGGATRGNQHLRLFEYIIPSKEPRRIVERESFPPGTVIVAGASAASAIAIQLTGTVKPT
jgi:hypothetical protein